MSVPPTATTPCPTCGHEVAGGSNFCEECGAPTSGSVCPACGSDTPGSPRYCPECGASQERTPARPGVASRGPTTRGAPAVGAPAVGVRPFLDARPALAAAAAAVIGAVFLPWIAAPGGSSDALDVPLALLWDRAAAGGGTGLAALVLPLAAVALLTVLVPRLSPLRRVLGALLTAIPVVVLVQFGLALDAVDVTTGVLSYAGAGLVVTLVGGVALTFGSR